MLWRTIRHLVFTVLFILVLVLPSWAARLFTCGFEEGVVTTTTMWTTAQANVTAVTTTPHSGTYSGRTTGTSNKNFGTNLAASVTSGTYFTRFYWTTNTAGIGDSIFFKITSIGGVSGPEITKLSTGKIRLKNVPTTETVDSTVTLVANTTYRFELKLVISDTVGDLLLNIYTGDSTTPLDTLQMVFAGTPDTLPTGIYAWTWQEPLNSASVTYLYDDIAINDATGSFQTSYPGPGKIYLLVPDSNVSMQWEDSAGGADNATFANIDDLPGTPNDADYNAADPTLDANDTLANDPTDQLGLTNLGAEVPSTAVLAVVSVYGRAGSNQTSAAHFRYKLWDEGAALTNGPAANSNVNGWKINTSAETLQYDASAKTKASLDGFNVGYETQTDTLVARPRRISALWANVEWIEAAPTNIPQGNQGILPGILR